MRRWPIVKLGDYLRFLTSGSRGWARHYASTGAKFLRIQNVGQNQLFLDDMAFVCPPESAEARRTRVEPGDVLLSITADLGRTCVVPENVGEAYINQHLAILRLTNDFHPSFIAGYLALGPGRWQIHRLDRMGVKSGLNFDDIRSLRVPLAPISEQRRIADILHKADAVRRKRQEAIELTEEFLRSAFLEMFGDPISNLRRWPVRKLSELASFIGGGTPSRDVPAYYEGTICWATAKDMRGEVLSDTEEHITEEAIRNSATKLVPAGCLLVVVKSKVLMHRLPVLLTSVPTCFGQDLKAIIPRDPAIARYLARHLRVGQSALLRKARGVNTEGLTLDHLSGYQVMMPSRERVLAYVQLEERAFQDLEIKRQAALESQELFRSLEQRAFRGEL